MTQKQTIVFGKQCWPVSPGLKRVNFHMPGNGKGFTLEELFRSPFTELFGFDHKDVK